jgi:polysaccharide biosynthesis protein PslH
MRILFFSPRIFWPADSGARIRDYYLLRALASQASLTFLGICRPDEFNSLPPLKNGLNLPPEAIRLVPQSGRYSPWNLLRGFVGPTPLSILNYYDAKVAGELHRLLRERSFDIVQIEGIHLAGYLPIIRSAPSHPLVICDWHDVESDRMARYSEHAPNWLQDVYARRTAGLLRSAERKLLADCDAHVMVSDRDLQLLRAMAPQIKARVIENGVDVALYPAPPQSANEAGTSVVFVGSMDFHPNIDAAAYFAREVWPKIHAQALELQFVIVGSRPVAAVRELAKLPGVVVTGTVEDVRPYYRNAMAAVAPLRIAGGTRLKILEAMAAGVPVVATRIGAEGLEIKSGQDFLLGDTPDEMASCVSLLYGSPALRGQLCSRGRELVKARYDWAALGDSLYRMHQDLLARRHA